jgi:hypothetical protein
MVTKRSELATTFAEGRTARETAGLGWMKAAPATFSSANGYISRRAESAANAKLFSALKNLGDWPLNNPLAVSPAAAACAPANLFSMGRITAHFGNFELMNSHGTGKMRFG